MCVTLLSVYCLILGCLQVEGSTVSREKLDGERPIMGLAQKQQESLAESISG